MCWSGGRSDSSVLFQAFVLSAQTQCRIVFGCLLYSFACPIRYDSAVFAAGDVSYGLVACTLRFQCKQHPRTTHEFVKRWMRGCLDLHPVAFLLAGCPHFVSSLNTSILVKINHRTSSSSSTSNQPHLFRLSRRPLNVSAKLPRLFGTSASVPSEQSAAAERSASTLSCGGWAPTRRSPTTVASLLCSTLVSRHAKPPSSYVTKLVYRLEEPLSHKVGPALPAQGFPGERVGPTDHTLCNTV